MIGRPLAGMLFSLFVVSPTLAGDPQSPTLAGDPQSQPAPAKLSPGQRDPLAGLELRMWEWRRLRNQLDMLPLTGTILPEDAPKLPDVTTFDKLVVDSLREVHNRGADLYNMVRDFEAAYRVYQGGLVAVRPLIAHRPAAQKLIEEGIAAADKEPTPARRAFKLHETIEAVRKSIKDANEPLIKPIEPEPMPKKKEPVEIPKKIEPIEVPKKKVEPEPMPKKKEPVEVPKKTEPIEVPKKKDPVELAPKPHEKKPAEVKKPKDPVE